MINFIKSLTPEQWAVIAGVISPVIHYLVGKVINFTTTHNWIVSFLLPLIGSVAVFLHGNTSFNHLVPLYSTVYATGQFIYFTTVRYWKLYASLVQATTPTTAVADTSF